MGEQESEVTIQTAVPEVMSVRVPDVFRAFGLVRAILCPENPVRWFGVPTRATSGGR